jgi:proteasome lid subunit RPN8/RPN11
MRAALVISAAHYEQLLAHLAASEDEQVAFFFTDPLRDGEPLRVVESYTVPASGFADQSPYYLALSDDVRAQVIGRATALGGCLVEVHSHVHGPAGFSPTDLAGFEEWVPHVRWRLGGRPYIALVFAGESFDALVWTNGIGRPGPLAELTIEGRGSRRPTDLTHRRIVRDDHDA